MLLFSPHTFVFCVNIAHQQDNSFFWYLKSNMTIYRWSDEYRIFIKTRIHFFRYAKSKAWLLPVEWVHRVYFGKLSTSCIVKSCEITLVLSFRIRFSELKCLFARAYEFKKSHTRSGKLTALIPWMRDRGFPIMVILLTIYIAFFFARIWTHEGRNLIINAWFPFDFSPSPTYQLVITLQVSVKILFLKASIIFVCKLEIYKTIFF